MCATSRGSVSWRVMGGFDDDAVFDCEGATNAVELSEAEKLIEKLSSFASVDVEKIVENWKLRGRSA